VSILKEGFCMMSKFRLAHLGLVVAALGFTAAPSVIGLSVAHAAPETVRQELGKPLQEAANLIKQGKHREALNKLKEADAVAKGPNENYLVERARAAAAAAAGDNAQAARSFEALLASGKLSAAEKEKFEDGLLSIYMRAKDYNKANAMIQNALKSGPNPRLRTYLIQNYFQMGNYAQAQKEVELDIRAAEKAGRAPSKDQLEMLANLYNRSGNKAAYVATIEKLVTSYPSPERWVDLLQRVSQKPGFSSRLSTDVLRLRYANGLLKKPSEYMELAQMLLQEKSPGEAMRVIEKGYEKKILGVGEEAGRHQRLKDLAVKKLAEFKAGSAALEAELVKNKDNDGLVQLGYGLAQAGETDRGLKMIEGAIKAGGLRNADDAKLRLGLAYAAAGKKQQAVSTLRTVGGTDGTAEIARYNVMALTKPLA
jgi:tetratricopeptide (TPR) repeat protein